MARNEVLKTGSQGEILNELHSLFTRNGVKYAFTGLTATSLYGFTIGNGVIDVAVKNRWHLCKALKLLGVYWWRRLFAFISDIYIFIPVDGYKIRLESDIISNSFQHPLGFWLQDKVLLLRRLEIYQSYETSIGKAVAFIALTVNDACCERYKQYWNRL